MSSDPIDSPSYPPSKAPTIRHPLPPMYPGGMRIDTQEEQAVLEVLRSKRLFRYYGPNSGPSKVEELEEAFGHFMSTRHAQAVTSGTAALLCGLAGLGIGPGDEVIVPAYTWIASASAVVAIGAVPIMAEVDESLTPDPTDLESKITPYTRAILPVHMRGAPCKMDEIMAVARKHNLRVLEDVAQANGGPWRNHPRRATYTPDMCPRTLDLLSRAVHLDISPELTSLNLEELADALNKVLEAQI